MPTPGNNIEAEAATQPMAAAAATSATASGSRPSSSNQPMEVGQPVIIPSTTTFIPSRPTGMPIPSDSPVIRPPPGLDEPVKHKLRTKTSYNGPESVLKRSKTKSQGVKRESAVAPEDLQIESGAATQERFNAMETIPKDVSHEDSLKRCQRRLKGEGDAAVTSDIILQDFDVDTDDKLKRAMQKEMDNLMVFTDVNIKSMSADEVSGIIDSRWVISERPEPKGSSRNVARGFIQAAFLNACVDESDVIHVKPPRELYSSPENQSKVWRLKAALYGVKNSPKTWQKHLVRVMVDQFKMCQLRWSTHHWGRVRDECIHHCIGEGLQPQAYH
eukprot:4879616-Amphidinium_carterae.3